MAGVLSQIAYPLLDGDALRIATVLSVLLLAAASLLHAAAARGARAAGVLLLVAGGLGLIAETVGVHTGFPFGGYHYTGSLGVRLAGVPLVVPLAWTMLAYPCLLLGRRLSAELGTRASWPGRRVSDHQISDRQVMDQQATDQQATDHRVLVGRTVTALAGGLGLAGWDLFLDPQMVAQGNWSWAHPAPALPGVPGVPLTNYAGWLLVAALMIATLDRALPALPALSALPALPTLPAALPALPGLLAPSQPARTTPATQIAQTPRAHPVTGHTSPARVGDLIPAAVLAWTWLGSAVGNLAFFDRPWVALYGGLAMGVVVLPYLFLEFETGRRG